MNSPGAATDSSNRQRHLWRAAELYRQSGSDLSRYYQRRFDRELQFNGPARAPAGLLAHVCPHCGTVWTGGNNTVRAKRQPACGAKVERLKKKLKRGGQLSQKQRSVLKASSNMCISTTCKACGKTVKQEVSSSMPAIAARQPAIDSISLLAAERNTPKMLKKHATRVQHSSSPSVVEQPANNQTSGKRKRSKKSQMAMKGLQDKLQENMLQSQRGSLSAFLSSL